MKKLWLAVAAVVVVAGIAAVVASAGGDDDEGTTAEPAQVADVTVTGDPLPQLPDGDADPALGTAAPTLEGVGFDGEPVVIEPGRPTLVLFVAHWCPHCNREVPLLLDHLAGTPLPDGVDLIAVSTAVDETLPNYPPSQWLEDEGWTEPVLVDSAEGTAAQAYGLPGFPYIVGLDADGNVVGRTSGEFPMAQFDALVAAVQD